MCERADMKRLGFCLGLVSLAAAILTAQSTPRLPSARPGQAPRLASTGARSGQAPAVPETFKTYCFECHGGEKHRGDVSIERLIQQSSASPVGEYWDLWDKVAAMIETK